MDSELLFVDVTAFIRSFEEDGNFSVEQLNRLSDSSPDAIPRLLEKWPHAINLRDAETGNTVLHHSVSSMKPFQTAKKWLSGAKVHGGVDYELLTQVARRWKL